MQTPLPSLTPVAATLAVLGAAGLIFTFLQGYIVGTWLGEFSLIGAGAGTIVFLSVLEIMSARLAAGREKDRDQTS